MKCISLKRKLHAQMKSFETIGILLAFFFIFGIGLKFYGTYQIRQIEIEKEQFLTIDAIKISNQIIQSSLLRCSESSIDEGQCVDEYKLFSLAKLFNSTFYSDSSLYPDPSAQDEYRSRLQQARVSVFEHFGLALITATFIYPNPGTYVIYNMSPELTNRTTSKNAQIPVYVYNKFENRKTLAILEVTLYG